LEFLDTERNPKVFVIGLDGGSLHLLSRLAHEGYMPFFASILAEGVSGELRSVFPPSTPSAWSTFLTGKNPGKHGIFEFFTYENSATPLRVVNSLSLRTDTLWSLLSRAEKRIGLVNVPMTYPPHPVNGTMITGLLTPSVEQTFTYPSSLYNDLKKDLGEYIIGVTWREYAPRQIRQFLEALVHCIQQRRKYVRYLMERYPWDFFMVVFSETDVLQHALWSFLDPEDPRQTDEKVEAEILAYYQLVDRILEELCITAGENTRVFLISDHGFGPLLKWMRINTWLNRLGVLAFDRKRVLVRRGARKLREMVRQIDRQNWRRKLPVGPVRKGYRTDILSCIRWEQTKAFSVLSGEQGVRINLRGREPKGIISPGREYEELRDSIITEMQNLRDHKTGELLGHFVRKREEIYTGPFLEQAPDIVFLLGGGKWVADVFPASKVFEPADLQFGTGIHRMEGLFVARGPGIKQNERLQGARIEDLLPTLLFSLGLSIPADIDGRILSDIYHETTLSSHLPSYAAPVDEGRGRAETYSADEEQQVIERLKGLGYIE